MTTAQFWYGDPRLFEAYRKAYARDVSFRSWQNGNYFFDAISKAIYNGFGRKKGEKAQQYVGWKDPIATPTKELTEEEKEARFREEQAAQSDWLFGKPNT